MLRLIGGLYADLLARLVVEKHMLCETAVNNSSFDSSILLRLFVLSNWIKRTNLLSSFMVFKYC